MSYTLRNTKQHIKNWMKMENGKRKKNTLK